MKKIICFLLSASFAFAQYPDDESHYQEAEKSLESYSREITGSLNTDDASPIFSSTESDNVVTLVPFSILVLPAQKSRNVSELEVIQKNPFSKTLTESLNKFFQENKYDVRGLGEQRELENFIQVQNAISGAEDDLAYLASLYIGADIYVRYLGELSAKKLKVHLNAYESTTGLLIGSVDEEQNVPTPRDVQKIIRIAAENAAKKLNPNIQKFHNSQRNFMMYKVLMNVTGEFDEDFIENLHELITSSVFGMFKNVVVNVMTEKTIDLNVSVSPAEYPNSQAVYSAIRTKLKSLVGVKKTNITRKMIFLELK